MPENVEAVSVNSESLRVRVAPGRALLTAWQTTLLQSVSFIASLALLILGALGTVNLSSVLPPEKALFWITAINVAQLMLRAFGVKPIVLDPPANVTVKSDSV